MYAFESRKDVFYAEAELLNMDSNAQTPTSNGFQDVFDAVLAQAMKANRTRKPVQG